MSIFKEVVLYMRMAIKRFYTSAVYLHKFFAQLGQYDRSHSPIVKEYREIDMECSESKNIRDIKM